MWVCVLGMSVVTVLRVDFLLCSSLSRLRSVPNVPNQSNPTVTRTPMRHSRLHRAQAASRPRSFTTTIRVFWKQLHEILEAEEQSRRFESLKVYDELLDQKLVKKRHERAVDVREFESDTSTIPWVCYRRRNQWLRLALALFCLPLIWLARVVYLLVGVAEGCGGWRGHAYPCAVTGYAMLRYSVGVGVGFLRGVLCQKALNFIWGVCCRTISR